MMSGGDFTSVYPLPAVSHAQPLQNIPTSFAYAPTQFNPSLAISTEDLASLWLADLQLDINMSTIMGAAGAPDGSVKTELPASDILNDQTYDEATGLSHAQSKTMNSAFGSASDRFFAALDEAKHNLPPPQYYEDDAPPGVDDSRYSSHKGARSSDLQEGTSNSGKLRSVTPGLLSWLPATSQDTVGSRSGSSSKAQTLTDVLTYAEKSSSHAFPTLDWNQFRIRATKMRLFSGTQTGPSPQQKAQRAHDIIYRRGAASKRPLPQFLSSSSTVSWHAEDEDHSNYPETLPFYAAVCAAVALGAHETKVQEQRSKGPHSSFPSPPRSASSIASSNPYPLLARDAVFWYALSDQALGAYEKSLQSSDEETTVDYPIEYIWALLLQLRFLVYAGPSLGHGHSDNTYDINTSRLGGELYSTVR
jgi:hypothetical protein